MPEEIMNNVAETLTGDVVDSVTEAAGEVVEATTDNPLVTGLIKAAKVAGPVLLAGGAVTYVARKTIFKPKKYIEAGRDVPPAGMVHIGKQK